MSTEPVAVVTVSKGELEVLIRRVVREEITRLLQPAVANGAHTEADEPDDPEGDEIIAREAMVQLEEIKRNPTRVTSWQAFEAELDEAEAAGELPT